MENISVKLSHNDILDAVIFVIKHSSTKIGICKVVATLFGADDIVEYNFHEIIRQFREDEFGYIFPRTKEVKKQRISLLKSLKIADEKYIMEYFLNEQILDDLPF